jgi:bifunctional non-homologous end joining protein LigD
LTTVPSSKRDEERAGVPLTNLDRPLFDQADATKRDLVDYLDALSGQMVAELRGRLLSVIRVLRGQAPFMQKNLPSYAPPWIRVARIWAEASKREVSYALCDDRRTLMWFANQRAVEYHPGLVRVLPEAREGDVVPEARKAETVRWDHPAYLVIDIDPPSGDAFGLAVQAALLVRQVLAQAGLEGAVKTSGAKGVHVFVPVTGTTMEDSAAATRALAARAAHADPSLATTAFIKEDRHGKVFMDSTRAGGATVVAAYSPRVRPGAPVSFPVAWDDLENVVPADFNLHTAARLVGDSDP